MADAAALIAKKGLPTNPDAERFVLGSILLDDSHFVETAGTLSDAHFSIEKHRRIFRRMADISARGDKIDRVTVANELLRHNELESVDGLSYLISLDDGLPHISNIESYVRIVRDKAGLRQIAIAAHEILQRAITATDSPDDILAAAENSFLKIGDDQHVGEDDLMQGGDFLRQFPGGLNSFAQPSKREAGLRTGFTRFDEMTGGLRAGELAILAARPSMGKTALAINMAWHAAANYNVPVAIFTLEMSRESLLLRMLCAAARVDSQRLRAGYMSETEITKIRAAANLLVDLPIFIDDSSNIGLLEIHGKLRRAEHKRKVKFGLVIVDYLQLMATRGKSENRNQEVTKLSRGLKLMSKDMQCPFLVLSQLSRQSENRQGDKRPQLQDLRESGSIEQDADLVAFLFREEVYKKDREDLRGLAELIISKQRSGPIGTVPLVFLHQMVKFENRAEDLGPEPEDNGRLPYNDE